MRKALMTGLVALALPFGAMSDSKPVHAQSNETWGTIIGGGAGALLGSRFGHGGGRWLGAGVGLVAGGFVGNRIGAYMDDQNKQRAQYNTQRTLETQPNNQTVGWSDPNNPNRYGNTTPTATYYNGNQPCREYTQTVYIDGKSETMRGRACRNNDGTWTNVQ
jgi:surface antigen